MTTAPPHDPAFWPQMARHSWDWSWIGSVWAPSLRIRASDLDGWVEHGGYLLFIEGKVTTHLRDAQPPETRVRTVAACPNVTHVTLRCAPDNWDAVQHQPTGDIALHLMAGPWPATAWRPARTGWMRSDDLSLFRDLCAQWSAWVEYRAPHFQHTHPS